jgi:pyridoxamine 5'-phosphate oxidase
MNAPFPPLIEHMIDPMLLFVAWLNEAELSEPNDPSAASLATISPDFRPEVRMVLVRTRDARGFVIYTNSESAKGRALAAHSKAALCWHWKSLRRQVRVSGPVEVVTAAEADTYFATRPRGSQIGAWASAQSRPLGHREELENAVRHAELQFANAEVPRPPHWQGYRLTPDKMEFWAEQPFRLHDRLVYTLGHNKRWEHARLYP